MPIPSICWLPPLVALLALEAATVGLVSLWFAVGSLCALLTSFFVGNIWVQFAVFLAVSFLCLVIIRPLARKYADPRRESTNADRVVGAEGCPAIPAGSRVRVLRIEGVKVIVSPLPVPTPGR